jgi:WD40 repeat protein
VAIVEVIDNSNLIQPHYQRLLPNRAQISRRRTAHLFAAGLFFLILALTPFISLTAKTDQLIDQSQHVLKLRDTLDAGAEVENVAVSPDGKTVAVFVNHTVQLWDATNGKLERTFTGFKKWPALCWSPDSSRLFLTNWGKTPAIWIAQPAATELRAFELKPKLDTVLWSRNGRFLLTTHSGNLFSVWDMQTLTSRFEQKLKKELLTARWSPDGRSIITASTDGGWLAQYKLYPHSWIQVWEAETGKEKFTIRLNGLEGKAEFSADGKYILTTGSAEVPELWDAETGKLHAKLNPPWCRHENCGTHFATLTCDSRLVVTGSGDWFQKEIWDVASGKLLAQIEGKKGGTFLIRGLSPDGRLLAVYRQHFKSWKSFAEESSIQLYDTSTGKLKVALTGKNMMWSGHQLIWSADSQTLVTAGGSHGYQGKVWDVATGKLRAELSLIAKESRFPFTACYDDLDDLSFHQSQPLLIGTSNKLVKLWDPISGELLQTIAGSYAQWSEDGRVLMARNVDGKSISIWELVNSGKVLTWHVGSDGTCTRI